MVVRKNIPYKKVLIQKTKELPKLKNFLVSEDVEISVYLKLKKKSIEIPISIVHTIPDKTSLIKIKVALYDEASIIMNANVTINKGAINSITDLNISVFLMKPSAKAQVTPALFIYEKNIISAGHSLIIKDITLQDTYYILSRGIPFEQAKELIIGF